jgi:non-ribosomal peptide synthetase component E (peptide arylation enzyme)
MERNKQAISNVPVYFNQRAVSLVLVEDQDAGDKFREIYGVEGVDVIVLEQGGVHGTTLETSGEDCTTDVFCLMQTGGSTTGLPKLVPITHNMARWEIEHYGQIVKTKGQGTVVHSFRVNFSTTPQYF